MLAQLVVILSTTFNSRQQGAPIQPRRTVLSLTMQEHRRRSRSAFTQRPQGSLWDRFLTALMGRSDWDYSGHHPRRVGLFVAGQDWELPLVLPPLAAVTLLHLPLM